jgi:hypothetical protein
MGKERRRIEGGKGKGNVGGRRKGKGKVERWEDRRNWKGNVGGKKEMGKERGRIEGEGKGRLEDSRRG